MVDIFKMSYELVRRNFTYVESVNILHTVRMAKGFGRIVSVPSSSFTGLDRRKFQ